MKAESVVSKFGDKLKQMSIDDYLATPDLIEAIPFIKISEIVRDGVAEITVRCPLCGKEFMNNDGRSACPSCRHNPCTSHHSHYWISSERENLSLPRSERLVAFLDTNNDLVSATFDVSATYSVSKKAITPDAALNSIGYFREETFDFFQRKGFNKLSRGRTSNSMYGHFKSSLSYRYSIPMTIPEATKDWCRVHGVVDAQDVVQYYQDKKEAKETIVNLDMSKMETLDYDRVVSLMRKKFIVKVSETEDKMNHYRKTFCYCCNCDTEFLDERDKDLYSGVKCPKCGFMSNPEAPPDENNRWFGHDKSPIAFIQQYKGDTVKNGIIYRMLQGTLACYLDADNVPIFQMKHTSEYCVLFDLNSKRFAGYSNANGLGYEPCDIYDHSVDPVIDAENGTAAAYCAADLVAKSADDGYGHFTELDLRKYLELYARYPVVEKMVKGGFVELISWIIKNPRTHSLYTWAKDAFKGANKIEDVYRLPKPIVRAAKDFLIRDVQQIRDVQTIYCADNTVTPKDVVFLMENRCSTKDMLEIMRMLPGMSVKRVAEYLEGVRVHQCCPPQIAMNLWCDYLRSCIVIGTDVNDKSVRYPNSLKREHDKVIARMSFIKDKDIEQRFSVQVTRYQKLFGALSDRFEIRAPGSMQELFEEGRLLSHSVGSYSDVISRGETCIMFIRDLKSPDTPYLTLEIDEVGMTVPQIRGFSNRLIDEEIETDVVEFIVAWAYRKKLNVDVLKSSKNVLKRLKDSGKIYRILVYGKDDEADESTVSVA